MKLYGRMLTYLWPYKWRVAQVLILSVLTAALSVGSLGAMKPLFDTLFASEAADLKIGMKVLDEKGREIQGLRIRPKMPEGWRGRLGRDWRIFEDETLVLEGYRKENTLPIPVLLKNRSDLALEGIRLNAEIVGKGWQARVEMPGAAASTRLMPGEEVTALVTVVPDRTHHMFTGAFWKRPGPRRVAEWLEDRVFANKFKALFIISALILITTLLKSLCFYSKAFWSNWLSKKGMVDLRKELFDSLISQSVTYFDRRKSGVIISKFTNSLTQMQKGMTAILSEVVTEPLMIVGALGLAFSINPQLTLIGLLIFPLNWLVILVTGKLIRRSTDRSLKERANMVQMLQRSIDGIRIVKAFVMEDHAREGFAEANDMAFRYDMRGAKAKSMLQPVVEIFSAGFVIVFLLLGGVSVLRGEMSPGDFITFYAGMVACYSPIKKVNNAISEIQESASGAADVFAELDRIPELREAPGAMELPRLSRGMELKHVSFHYDKTAPVLRDVSLRIDRGEFVALVGPSGAGKSTLVNLVPRFYDVTEGVFEIDGVDIRTVTLDSLRRQIGFVTQEPVLFHDTIANNIAFGEREATMEQIEAAARTAHAHEFIKDLPNGYQTVVGDRGVMMSGGQRQRIALARAVMRNPEILLLDEATSSLDTESERLIQDAMDKFVKGRTTIVIAHRLSTILHADRIVVMDQGRLVQTGTHQELLAAGGMYRRLYEMQFRDQAEPLPGVPAGHPLPA
ncbi:MAG TPA: ABC transporter ATP-binding protein [Candidatus Polarisedimenticolia bacterium]|nr:ABC transporter ATP-binding protein [Candidatus Polarisedimenticolia bacterium]